MHVCCIVTFLRHNILYVPRLAVVATYRTIRGCAIKHERHHARSYGLALKIFAVQNNQVHWQDDAHAGRARSAVPGRRNMQRSSASSAACTLWGYSQCQGCAPAGSERSDTPGRRSRRHHSASTAASLQGNFPSRQVWGVMSSHLSISKMHVLIYCPTGATSNQVRGTEAAGARAGGSDIPGSLCGALNRKTPDPSSSPA